MQAKYKRVILKISGEALSGEVGHGFDKNALNSVAKQIREVKGALVTGGAIIAVAAISVVIVAVVAAKKRKSVADNDGK